METKTLNSYAQQPIASRPNAFRKRSMPILTVDVILSKQIFRRELDLK